MIKVVKVAEPISLSPTDQAIQMIAKAKARARREGTPIGATKVLIVVEQEFDDGK